MNTIEEAILALSAMDGDRASLVNGVGYNGRDTAFGNSLAMQIRNGRALSLRQRQAAHKMLRTYTKQLAGYGITYADIATPTDGAASQIERTKTTVELAGEVLVVGFTGYPGPLLPHVKGVPGRRYVAQTKQWLIPLNPTTLAYIETWPEAFVLPDDARELIADMYRAHAIAEVASRATDAELDLPIARDLFPFQRAGVAYAVEHRRVIIGDEMGLGKTVQALATIEHEGCYPALVVVPAVVKLNWQREIERWLPERAVVVLSGTKNAEYVPPGFDIVVVNYDILGAWKDALQRVGWRATIFDESHYLKNEKAKRTKVAKAIAGASEMRLLLTGTPVLNRPIELASQLDILGRLNEVGGFWGFAKRYCGAYKDTYGWNMSGASNLTELNKKLRSTCMVRRTKDEVLTELPAKRPPAIVPLELADRAAYDKVKKELAVWLKQRILADQAWMARMRELGADADAEAQMQAWRKERSMGRAATLVKIEALRDTAARQKLPAVIAWIEDFIASGSKLVAFAHHVPIVEAIAEHFGDAAVKLYGDTRPDQRQAVVDRFQNDPNVRLFVGNLQAAGIGITLTASSDVAIVELPWRPGDLSQAEDRTHRIGQTDSVTPWYLLAADTIEERIAGMLDSKRAVVNETTDGKVGLADGESIVDGLIDALESET